MEHYRSTLATTALAVLGLVTATFVLHPGYFEHTTRSARRAPAVATVWVDPPGEPVRQAALPVIVAMNARAPIWTAAASAEDARQAAAPVETRKADRHGTRRAAHTEARTRQALLDRGDGATPAPAPQAETAAKTDPIGDLIHSLGLGREG